MYRLAIWIHGGVGGGLFSQGQPPIQQLIDRLSGHFEIEVFSLQPPNKGFASPRFKIYSLANGESWPIFRWTYLIWKFFSLSVKRRYHLVYGFWGYPAGSLAVILGKICGIPSIIHLQGGDAVGIRALNYGVFCHPFRARLCRFSYASCDRLIVLTKYQADCLKENRISREPVVIPFGPDLRNFTFKPRTCDTPVLRFLHVGNQTPIKGQETMLEVFAEVANQRPSRLVIVGEDYYDGRLKKKCVSLNIEHFVQFIGPQPHDRMPQFYHDADVFLHTPWYEGQGVVFAEAAACGALVAGTSVGMLSDMGDDSAIIVSPGEAKALAHNLLVTLADSRRVKKIQESARRRVEEKDVNYTERKIVETIEEVLDHAETKRPKVSTDKVEG